MFRYACEIARNFTIPIIVMQRKISGECQSTIGAGVIINKEGWLLTAHHIVRAIFDLQTECDKTQERINERAQIEQDMSLSSKEKRRKLNYARLNPESAVNFQVCYGFIPGLNVRNWTAVV